MSSHSTQDLQLEGSSSAPFSSQHTLSTEELDSLLSSQGHKSEDSVPHPVNTRVAALQSKKTALEESLATLLHNRQEMINTTRLRSGLTMPNEWSDEYKSEQAMKTANGIIKDHIAMLHKYNEIKDIAQGLMGMIAERKGARMADVMEDFSMTSAD